MEAWKPHSMVILICANLNFVKSYSVLNLFAKKLFSLLNLYFLEKFHENWLRGVIKCALHKGAYKNAKN